MGPITAIIPRTRAIPLGGRAWRVAEFTLRDLATLQGLLDDSEPDALLEIQDALSAGDPAAKQHALARAYEKAEKGPPVYGDPEGYFTTAEGAVAFLWVALSRLNECSPAEAARLFLECSAAEYGHVWRVCHGVPTLRAIEKLLFPALAPQGMPPSGRDWPDLIDELSRERNWTYEYIYSLTLTEWVSARCHGSPPESGVVLPCSPEEASRIAAEQERLWLNALGGGDTSR